MVKKNRIRIKKWKTVALGSMLMLTSSLGGRAYFRAWMDAYQPEKFMDEMVHFANFSVSKEHFYKNIFEKKGVWYYHSDKYGDINLNDASDYQWLGDLAHRSFQNVKASTKIDTVEIKLKANKKDVMYAYGNLDSLPNMPAMGKHNWGLITIREFTSLDPKIFEEFKIYNNDYNCTWRHEYQHFLNAKHGSLKVGQSYETKFSEACMDEISANIAQLLAQRENYLKTGGDINHITDRFKFYREWLLTQPQPLSIKPSEEERHFIANGVLDAWKNEKFELYEKQTSGIAEYRLSKADYLGCVDHPEEHLETMRKFFYIDGMDFYKYIDGREKEFVEKLSPEIKERFAKLTKAKKEKMRYLERVGQYTGNDPKKKNSYFKGVKAKYLWNSKYKV